MKIKIQTANTNIGVPNTSDKSFYLPYSNAWVNSLLCNAFWNTVRNIFVK